MSNSPKIGETRPLAESPEPLNTAPPQKKPKLDATTAPSVKQNLKKLSARQRKKKQREDLPEPCSPDDVLWRDVTALLGKDYVDSVLDDGSDRDSPFEFREEVELEVVALSSGGE